jgi:hypothetical protein
MIINRRYQKFIFISFLALSLSGCWKDTPICDRLQSEIRAVQIGKSLSKVLEIAKAYINGEEEKIKALKLDPVLSLKLGRLRQKIVDNQCIDFEAGGIRG